jgi:rhodanese-related sulfurtransferase
MDGIQHPISPEDLYKAVGTAAAPRVVDVRWPDDFDAADSQIVGSIRRLPNEVERWRHEIPDDRPVVVYCVRGQQISQRVVAALAAAGLDVSYLQGGITAWRGRRLPTRRRNGVAPSKLATRERPTIDRIACPWLIRRFIDPEAEFIYVPAATVLDAAETIGATPFDVPRVEFGHHDEFCSFNAFIRMYGISDRALDRLALIVRGADTGRSALMPQSQGLLAISQGLKLNFSDDHAMLTHGMVLYDALYAWCRWQTQQGAGL